MKEGRRSFIKSVTVGTAGLTIGFPLISKGDILGANERVRIAIMGTNGRGNSLSKTISKLKNVEIVFICDVGKKAREKGINSVKELTGKAPKGLEDFREALDDNTIDALVVAAPDHWHTPAAVLACKAGKHVYLEKPGSHNPGEGDLIIQAARKYNRLVQLGTQRRSWDIMKQAMDMLHNEKIGKVYFAKAWYANNRGPIGVGKVVSVPKGLNYELWQGPAPRMPYKDNLIHYNWHWHWNWGTGEALNNGTHEMDLIRWGFNADYATKIVSTGGRYHYQDDWETTDTQIINFEFGSEKSAIWEGRSCNGRPVEGSGRGVVFYGTDGTMFTDGGNKFQIFDKKNQLVDEIREGEDIDVLNTASPSGSLDAPHLNNFFDAIRLGTKLNAEIESGFKSALLCHLGNIAQKTGSILHLDPQNGRILNNPVAMKHWNRKYENGWEPKV